MTVTQHTHILPPAEPATEPLDPVACLSSRELARARSIEPGAPGRYVQVRGPGRQLLVPLDEHPLHVGRGIAAGLHLDHPSVSRRHAIIVRRGSGARILDDRSLNGTFVNGGRIEQAELRDGDLIVIGQLELRYVEVPQPPRASRAGAARPRRDGYERKLQPARRAWRAQREPASATAAAAG
jgi:hypothetical protein